MGSLIRVLVAAMLLPVVAHGQIQMSGGGNRSVIVGRTAPLPYQVVYGPQQTAKPDMVAKQPEEQETTFGEQEQVEPVQRELPAAWVDRPVPVPVSQPMRQTISSQTVTERWLISEPWCGLCPAAKARFIQSGGRPDHIVNMATARALHGIDHNPPFEYTTTSVVQQAAAVAPRRVAIWQGKEYTAPVCNDPTCEMCQSIRDQLAAGEVFVVPPQDAVQQPSSEQAIAQALSMLQMTSNDLLAELGCGDARVLIQAVQQSRGYGIGYEIDEKMVETARKAVRKAEKDGIIPEGHITILHRDVTQMQSLPAEVTAVYAYQFPETLRAFAPLMRGHRVVSPYHSVQGLEMRKPHGTVVWTTIGM